MGLCSSLDSANPLQVDLSHFELMKVVGKGGFGKVNAVAKKGTQELMALKRMEKYAVLQSQAHLNMVWVERHIMSLTSSPFLCHLVHAFQSDVELFLIMPFMQGGDLRYHLQEHGPLREEAVRFYAAEILCGLEDLHAKRVVFRDLKPENILLDAEGHVRISDFGLGCQLTAERRYQVTGQAGTRGYQAPEVLMNKMYGCEVDVWSFGITVYELAHGQRPWRSANGGEDDGSADPFARFKDLPLSPRIPPLLASFLRALLTPDWRLRLGCAPKRVTVSADGRDSYSYTAAEQRVDWSAIRAHPFFTESPSGPIDWEALRAKSVPPPFVPDISRANCSADADLADQLLDQQPRKIDPEQQKHFRGWEYNIEVVGRTTAAGAGGASKEEEEAARAIDAATANASPAAATPAASMSSTTSSAAAGRKVVTVMPAAAPAPPLIVAAAAAAAEGMSRVDERDAAEVADGQEAEN